MRVLSELLRGQAILWYGNNRHQILTCPDFVRMFKTYFVPTEYQVGLEEEISRRVQKPQEKGRDFLFTCKPSLAVWALGIPTKS